MGKGRNNEQKQTQKAEPWAPIRPMLMQGFGDLQKRYSQGAPGFFPGSTVAGMSGFTRDSLNAMADRARTGNPLMDQAGGEISKILGGGYLDPNNNPGFQGALSAAIRPITNAFSSEVMPGIDSAFSSAGRYGSGMQGQAYSDASENLARGIGDVSANMAFNNYGMERGNMMSALGMAPAMAANDYRDISMLGLAGQGMEGYDQRMIDADRERYDYNANKDMGWLANYVGLLGGAPPPTTTSTTKTPAPSPWATALGLAGTAAGAYFGGPAGASMGGRLGGALGGGIY